MELTIQEAHTYNNLVKEGKEKELYFRGLDQSENSKLVVPKLDENSTVYFYDIVSSTKIYPGIETIKLIKDAVDKALKAWYCSLYLVFK